MELVCGEEILEAEVAVDFRLAVLRPDRETGLNYGLVSVEMVGLRHSN